MERIGRIPSIVDFLPTMVSKENPEHRFEKEPGNTVPICFDQGHVFFGTARQTHSCFPCEDRYIGP